MHVGDILAKGDQTGSLSVLSYMATHNITGVRGNHDQIVIEWRGWLNYILSQPLGSKWLEEMERKSKKEVKAYMKHQGSGWRTIPKGWDIFSDHYSIARAMSGEAYEYLTRLPLVLHLPQLHAFIVHAGLLPMDLKLPFTSPLQPLSHVPSSDGNATELRLIQEAAIVSNISQNSDPWTVLNMRSILNNDEVTKENKKGHPWSELWNSVVDRCAGFDVQIDAANSKQSKLPCLPSTVVYGHAAARGLDIKQWTKGLDSGCVYSKQLTAMVLSSGNLVTNGVEVERILFGDKRLKAGLVQVDC